MDVKEVHRAWRKRVPDASDDAVYDANEVAFACAMNAYKATNHRPHPRWSEVLAVLLALGWTPPPITQEHEEADTPFPPLPNRRLGNTNARRKR